MAHVDPELTQFIRFLRTFFPKSLGPQELSMKLGQAVEFISEYVVNDRLPQMGASPEPPVVLDRSTDGFVVAEARHPSLGEAWVHLFRGGFVRGVTFSMEERGRRHVLGARKGPFVQFNLSLAASQLNEIERAMGEAPEWKADALWLYSPPEGTIMLATHMLQVLVRV
jgi:hypothetical protein